MSNRFAAALLSSVAALSACQAAETPEQTHARMLAESDSARVAIEAKAAAFAEAVNTGQADAVAALYTDDAVLMPPEMPAITGREAIRATFAGMMAASPGMRIAFQVLDVTANGPLAVERGTWTISAPTPDGAATELRGKYLIEWHRIAGEWLIARDIWNSDEATLPM